MNSQQGPVAGRISQHQRGDDRRLGFSGKDGPGPASGSKQGPLAARSSRNTLDQMLFGVARWSTAVQNRRMKRWQCQAPAVQHRCSLQRTVGGAGSQHLARSSVRSSWHPTRTQGHNDQCDQAKTASGDQAGIQQKHKAATTNVIKCIQ